MAKGWNGIEEQTEALAAQSAEFAKSRKPELRVGQNRTGPFTIRFLEQGADVHNYPVHTYQQQGPQGTFSKQFTCLSEIGQPCPGCQAGMKIKRRGVFNVIWRGRPQLRRGQDGRAVKGPDGNWIIDGYQDEVVIANVGGPTAEMLRKTDGQYQGLMSRDFVVQFSGDKFQSWTLFPAVDGQGNSMATPMSEQDFALAANKHDLDEYMKPPSFQEASQIVARYGPNSGAAQQQPGSPPAQATQHGPGVGQAGANGFLGQPTVSGQPNTFGAVAPGTTPTPPPTAPPSPAPTPAPTPAPPAPAPQPQPQQ